MPQRRSDMPPEAVGHAPEAGHVRPTSSNFILQYIFKNIQDSQLIFLLGHGTCGIIIIEQQ